MMTEARSGFTAFNEGTEGRPRGRLRAAAPEARRRQSWVGPLHDEIQPGAKAMADAAASPLKAWVERDGALLRLRLARPKANIVDAAMIAALQAALVAHRGSPACAACCSTPRGRTSASAPASRSTCPTVRAMLASLHALILAMVGFPAPILVAVRGQCLGGGLEVALAGGPIFAAPDAQFGQPEMKLGVFAPAASVPAALARQPAAAEDLLFSGRSISASEARAAAWCTRWPTTPRPPRWRTSTSTWRPRAPPRWPVRCRRARGAPARRCASGWPRSSGCTSTA
jgi:hypothetical protein